MTSEGRVNRTEAGEAVRMQKEQREQEVRQVRVVTQQTGVVFELKEVMRGSMRCTDD